MRHAFLTGALIAACLGGPALAGEFDAPLGELAKGEVAAIAASGDVVAAIKAQNAATAGYDQAKLDELDQAWRTEVDAASRPMIDGILASPASGFLKARLEESAGLFTEIFIMDGKGLNVAQSDVTSDYWQGDEAKWQETFGKGAGSVHISDVELDESTQTYQSQVSVPVVDPADGSLIGAATFGVNVELLQ